MEIESFYKFRIKNGKRTAIKETFNCELLSKETSQFDVNNYIIFSIKILIKPF